MRVTPLGEARMRMAAAIAWSCVTTPAWASLSDDVWVPHPLNAGAGQEVGRSCALVRMGGRSILLDCGMHMGFSDARR